MIKPSLLSIAEERPRLSPRVRQLFLDFIAYTGLPPVELDDQADGLEFTSGDFGVSLYPLSADSPILSVDILVLGLAPEPADAERLLFLHRLNDATRVLTGWLATIDSEDVLTLSRRLRVLETDVELLAATVVEGLDRSERLLSTWAVLGELPPEPAPADSGPTP